MSRTLTLWKLFVQLRRQDPKVAAAIVTILEIVVDIDRRRASRLVEAVATIVAFATRPAPRTVRP